MEATDFGYLLLLIPLPPSLVRLLLAVLSLSGFPFTLNDLVWTSHIHPVVTKYIFIKNHVFHGERFCYRLLWIARKDLILWCQFKCVASSTHSEFTIANWVPQYNTYEHFCIFWLVWYGKFRFQIWALVGCNFSFFGSLFPVISQDKTCIVRSFDIGNP